MANISDLGLFAQDLYDVLGMNTNFETQRDFFNRYVMDDDAFMIYDEGDKYFIFFDDVKITISKR